MVAHSDDSGLVRLIPKRYLCERTNQKTRIGAEQVDTYMTVREDKEDHSEGRRPEGELAENQPESNGNESNKEDQRNLKEDPHILFILS
jgi:hypothetical protein